MKEIDTTKLRRTKEGDLLLRYAVWRQKGWTKPTTVSLYALARTTTVKWRILHREELAGWQSDEYCEALAKRIADMWAVLNSVGDTYLYRGVRLPAGVELEPLSSKEKQNELQ